MCITLMLQLVKVELILKLNILSGSFIYNITSDHVLLIMFCINNVILQSN